MAVDAQHGRPGRDRADSAHHRAWRWCRASALRPRAARSRCDRMIGMNILLVMIIIATPRQAVMPIFSIKEGFSTLF